MTQRYPKVEPRKELLSILVYSLCSIGMTLFNKVLLSAYSLPFPTTFLLLQSGSVLLFLHLAKLLGLTKFRLSLNVALKTLPLSVSFALMIYSSLQSLLYLSISAQTIIKNCAIIGTAVCDKYFYGRPITRGVVVSFFLISLGSYLGTVGDPWVTSKGLGWVAINIIFTIAFSLYFKHLLKLVPDIGTYTPVYVNNLLAFLLFIAPGLKESHAFCDALRESASGAYVMLGFMTFLSSALAFSVVWCMRETTPTTINVVGAVNKAPVSLLGIVIFQNYPTHWGYVGIALSLLGGLLYAKARSPG